MNKTFKNDDGSYTTLLISSDDNREVNIGSNYKLVNFPGKKASRFKNSVFGADIGVGNTGFASMAIVSTIIAIGAFVAFYLTCRI